jgi:hypothetical protein
MQSLVRARFLALDSSQLGDWSRDQASADQSRRNAAARFERVLLENGVVVLLCWHHFEELLRTRNIAVADARVHFIKSLPIIGWVAQADGQEGLGTIVDVLAAEAKAAFELGNINALAVRNRVSNSLVKVGTGEQALAPYSNIWRELQPMFWAREQREREIVALTRSTAFDISGLKVVDLLEGRIRGHHDIARQLGEMYAALTHEIATRGDKRITSPPTVAGQFFSQVVETAMPCRRQRAS